MVQTGQQPSSGSKWGYGCAVLFCLPFAVVAVFCGWNLFNQAWSWQQARSWVETPCTILSVKLDTNSDGEGTTYQVKAQYKYEIHGRLHQSDRVWFTGGSDNIGNFQHRVYRVLKQHHESDQPYRCFVNPRLPTESVLERGLRIEMVAFLMAFVLTFGGFGIGGLLAIVYGLRQQRAFAAAMALRPDQPWTWDADWREGRFNASQSGTYPGLLFGYFFCALSGPMVIISLMERWPKGLDFGPIVFLIIGLGALLIAAYIWRANRRFGPPELVIQPWPCCVGDELHGTIEFTKAVPEGETVTVELQSATPQSEGADTVHHRWTQQITCGPKLRFRFPLPTDVPRSTMIIDDGETIKWLVHLTGPDQRHDLDLTYDIMVFDRPVP